MPLLVHISDLHLDFRPQNLRRMLNQTRDVPADLYLIGGDNGLRRTINALRAMRPHADIGWVHGNHDVWGHSVDWLWREQSDFNTSYLELHNLETDYCTAVGSYGHYDYSGGSGEYSVPQYESFTNGLVVWNDHYIDRQGLTNPQIAARVASRFEARYAAALMRDLPSSLLNFPVFGVHLTVGPTS